MADTEQLLANGQDLGDLAFRGANIFLEMIFRDGLYHADPHPGNIFAMQNSAIGLLDFGMVGRIDDQLRERFEDLLMALAERNSQAVCDSICEMGAVPRELDQNDLRTELEDFLAEFGSQNLDELDLGGALNRMMEIIRNFKIVLPAPRFFADQSAGYVGGYFPWVEPEIQFGGDHSTLPGKNSQSADSPRNDCSRKRSNTPRIGRVWWKWLPGNWPISSTKSNADSLTCIWNTGNWIR